MLSRVVLLILLLMSVTGVAVAEEGGKEKESETGIKYIAMDPKFTVNLADPKKFLLIKVELLVEGAETIAAVKKHMPALRHELIMLYGGKRSEDLQSMEQREALRQETAAVIRKTLERMEGGKGEHPNAGHEEGFKDAYFAEFLMD
jgi:flagellar FliL protein